MRVALAKQGVFQTVQGEGAMLGVPMTFIRLAGCSVGCPLCDTDYKMNERVDVNEVINRVKSLPKLLWVWITGGEPTDQPSLTALVSRLKDAGYQVAVATAGINDMRWVHFDWLSVSPHDPKHWTLNYGSELKLVPGLNGFGLDAFAEKAEGFKADHKFVSPCEGKPETVEECRKWVVDHPGWRMTCQAHKAWGMT